MKRVVLLVLMLYAVQMGCMEMSPELQKIFGELSWASKIKLLDKYVPDPNKGNWSMNALLYKRSSVGPASRLAKGSRRFDRKVGMGAFRQPPKPGESRRQTMEQYEPTEPAEIVVLTEDERDMKLKLFRLMYETVRDSDLKVKRAELIKSHYTNSTSFEVGFLLGDVTEKFNVMTDIAATLRRLYVDWKPIEHINAYEQIANQAIEINHLIDIVRSVHKRDAKVKQQAQADKRPPTP